ELSEIDTRIESFFGDIQDDEAVLEAGTSDTGGHDMTDVVGLKEEEEISEVFEDDLNAFFAEPLEESVSAAPPETLPEDDAEVTERDDVSAAHAAGTQVPIEDGEEEKQNLIEEDIWDDMLVEESAAESFVAAVEPAGEEDDDVLFEAITEEDAADDLEEIPLGLLEDEIETETEPEEQTAFESAAPSIAEEELEVEIETETEPGEQTAFESAEPFIAEEELEDEHTEGGEEIARGSFFDVFASGSGAASVIGTVADPGEDDLSVSGEPGSAQQDEPEEVAAQESEIADNAEVVSSFGSDSEEEAFFASIDHRIDEPGEIQIELLTESDDVERELITDHDEEDAELYEQGPEAESAGEIPESLPEQQVTQPEMPLFAIDDEFSGLRAGIASLGVEINDRIVDGLLTEVNQVRQRMVSRPVDKTFLQLLSTIVQHIGHYKYEASSDAHTLMLSVFDKLELCRKDSISLEQSQEILLAETCKVLLWQQKMLDRQAVKQKDELRSVAPIHTATAEMEKEGSTGAEDELQTIADSELQADSGSEQDFSAVFEPVDEEDFAAIEEIETTQETIEQELGDTLLEDEQQVRGEGRADSVEKEVAGDAVNLPEVVKPEGKIDIKGLSVLLSGMIKREMKGLKDLLQTELKSLKDKFKDKE
ncbi:MAG: hypothetical protein V2I35_00275, partial [Desulfocapsaceae bacterium]|nr:hypothetical protein [Desulfocapsaceae bacterium]